MSSNSKQNKDFNEEEFIRNRDEYIKSLIANSGTNSIVELAKHIHKPLSIDVTKKNNNDESSDEDTNLLDISSFEIKNKMPFYKVVVTRVSTGMRMEAVTVNTMIFLKKEHAMAYAYDLALEYYESKVEDGDEKCMPIEQEDNDEFDMSNIYTWPNSDYTMWPEYQVEVEEDTFLFDKKTGIINKSRISL